MTSDFKNESKVQVIAQIFTVSSISGLENLCVEFLLPG